MPIATRTPPRLGEPSPATGTAPVQIKPGALSPAALAAPLTEFAHIPISGHPFASVFSSDGNTLFVSVDVDLTGGIAVLTSSGGHYAFTRFVALRGTPGGLALTPDGSTLVVTNGSGLALLDAKALAGSGDPNVRTIEDSPSDGSIGVVVSPNGYAYFTNEQTGTVGVANVNTMTIAGHVKLDSGPVGIALTSDNRSLFVTSEVASSPVSIKTCAGNRGVLLREGTLTMIDAAAAVTDPEHAIRQRAAAGCAPSRVVIVPANDVAWVSARDDNQVLAFDAAHFATLKVNSPFGVSVGSAPIGLALLDGGRILAVANSNRFSEDATMSTMTLVDTAAAFATGRGILAPLPTGGFPREFAVSRDGTKVALTNFRTNSVQLFGVTR